MLVLDGETECDCGDRARAEVLVPSTKPPLIIRFRGCAGFTGKPLGQRKGGKACASFIGLAEGTF